MRLLCASALVIACSSCGDERLRLARGNTADRERASETLRRTAGAVGRSASSSSPEGTTVFDGNREMVAERWQLSDAN